MNAAVGAPLLVERVEQLPPVLERAARADVVAVDVEGNGLFAYRARLCTVQLAWRERDADVVAVIDTLAVSAAPLGRLLGDAGPTKLLHDLTFDARLLLEAGVTLGRVRDTSVAARMLGRKATGLASLLAGELGITVAKELQQHDWSRRPLGERELSYLAADVRFLEALDAKLAQDVARLGIGEEVSCECDYKLGTALALAPSPRPAYLRVKGSEALDATGLAVLRRVVEVRERAAEKWDVPPFKVTGNDLLLEIARRRPTSRREIEAMRGGGAGRVAAIGADLLEAVRRGVEEGAVPPEERVERQRPDRAALAERRAREARLSAWRRAEAAARGVDEQVVLPGHCLQELASGGARDAEAIAAIAGLGASRAARYAEALASLVRGDGPASPPPADAGT